MTYSIGHIYKIICNLDSNFCYIGSTFDQLRNRWQGHKGCYKNKKNSMHIHKYFDKYDIKNFKIILIKSYKCCRDNHFDFKHLHAYETLWINKTKNCININLPFTPMKFLNEKESKKNWVKNNKEKNYKSKKKYRDEHPNYGKEYYKKNKDIIKKKTKVYRSNNKEQKAKIDKEYYENNKKTIRQKQNEKVTCSCGCITSKQNIKRHQQTQKHINLLNSIKQ